MSTKIACVDRTASERIALQRTLEEQFEQSRHAVGHLSLLHFVTVSKQELLLSKEPEAAVIGPGYTPDEAVAICKCFREAFSALPVFVLVRPEDYSLRVLRRFHGLSTGIFTTSESPVRLVHELSSLSRHRTTSGVLVALEGAKGGVGASSICAALAHAAETQGKSAVVVDLSADQALLCMLEAPRRTSPDFAALLHDKLIPTRHLVDRCIVQAPNGISALLPPAGGHGVRRTWLHDQELFELTLMVLEFLQEMFDLVLVDTARTEGILNFGILSRADVRLIISSNEPSSVFLAERKLRQFQETPGASQVRLIVNHIHQRSMNTRDILLAFGEGDFKDGAALLLGDLPHDSSAGGWAGSGNSFYTEGTTRTRQICEQCVALLLSRSPYGAALDQASSPILQRILGYWNPKRLLQPKHALPWPATQPTRAIETQSSSAASTRQALTLYEPPKPLRSLSDQTQPLNENLYMENVA